MGNNTILIIDDDENAIKLLKVMLKSENYNLLSALRGEEGQRLLHISSALAACEGAGARAGTAAETQTSCTRLPAFLDCAMAAGNASAAGSLPACSALF